jgi:hypothetical protein
MSDNAYLKKLVESMLRRVTEIVKKEEATTGYMYELKINVIQASIFSLFNSFLHEQSCLIADTVNYSLKGS